jgi:hypothetical protein
MNKLNLPSSSVFRRLALTLASGVAALGLAGCGGLSVGLDLGYAEVYYDAGPYSSDPYGYYNQPPTVAMSVSRSSARVGEVIRLSAAANDDYGVSYVEFFVVDSLQNAYSLGRLGRPPYVVDTTVPQAPQGLVYYFARAVDGDGQYRDSPWARVDVLP